MRSFVRCYQDVREQNGFGIANILAYGVAPQFSTPIGVPRLYYTIALDNPNTQFKIEYVKITMMPPRSVMEVVFNDIPFLDSFDEFKV